MSAGATLNTATPVLLLRCSRHGGLGITRTLGRMGVPVYHVDRTKSAPGFHSRYSRGRFIWDTDAAAPGDTVRFLGEVAAAIGRRAILVPTSDGAAMMVADHGDALSRWFDFPRMEPSLVRALCSKREMYWLAKKYGIPTPGSVFPQTRKELLEYCKSMKFPVMAKGIFGIELARKAGKRMFLVHSRLELLQLFDSYEDWFRPNFILQEFIPGDAGANWMFNGYFDQNSECLFGSTGRKIRQYPATGGLTSLGECVRNETVVKMTQEFVKASGYRGPLDIDYRYDERDGQYKVLDINPRIGATFRLFAGANDIDVARAMYLDMTGQHVESAPAREGRRWLVEDCDLVSSCRSFYAGDLALGDWLRSYRGIEETGVFAWNDPLPAFWMGVRHLERLWDRKFRSRPVAVPAGKPEFLL